MRFPTFFLTLAFLSRVLAIPLDTLVDRGADLSDRNDDHLHDDFTIDSISFADEHEWIPAEDIPGSSRSPCPFLNTMANHGLLKRDGRNLSMSDFNNVLSTVVNFGDGFIQSTFTPPQFRLLGILADNQNHTDTTIDLETLNLHNRNEHDASMSRLDRIQGDTIQVQPDLVEKILCDTVPEDYSYLNTSSIGRTRVRRENESRAASGEPSENMTIIPGVVEGALALLFIGEGLGEDADNMFMRKESLREWMVFERIPKEFRRSERVIVTDDLARIIDKVDYWRTHWLET